jgi:hypothetical protein
MAVRGIVDNLPLWRVGVLDEFVGCGYQAVAILQIDEQWKSQGSATPADPLGRYRIVEEHIPSVE